MDSRPRFFTWTNRRVTGRVPPWLAVLLPELPPPSSELFGDRLIQHSIVALNQLDAATHAAESGKGVHNGAIGNVGKSGFYEIRRGVKELRKSAVLARMNDPIGPLCKILFGDTKWLLPILGKDKANLITLTS